MAQGTINTLCCGACTDTGSLVEAAPDSLNPGHCGNYMEVLSNYAAQPGNPGTGSVVLHYCSSDPNCGCEVAADRGDQYRLVWQAWDAAGQPS